MSLDLFVVRKGVQPDRYVGHVLTVPPVPVPEVAEPHLSAKGDVGPEFEDALFGDLLAGVGRPGRVIPFGLVEPTPWERRFVTWVAQRIGVEPEAGWDRRSEQDRNEAFVPLAAALADPLAPAPPGSPAVKLIEADDPELEAHAAARYIRAWLAAQPATRWPEALDEVLVLLPGSSDRRATWKRVLERHGLAADASGYASFASRPLGRWLSALARVARWRKEPVHRDRLRAVLLGPFVSMPSGARRADVRDCLRALRGPSVSLALWRDHLESWRSTEEQGIEARDLETAERKEALEHLAARHGGLTALTDALDGQLASAETLFRGLAALVDALGVSARVRASRADQAIRELEAVRAVLERLAEEEQLSPRRPVAEKLRELDAALEELPIRTNTPLAHGVSVTTYGQYDGRRARLVVLAGLEEGGFPRAPVLPSRAEAVLAARLGLGTPEDELLRQARIAAAAAARSREQVLLSYSRTDEAGSDTFPGSLLAAVRARKDHPGLPATRFGHAQAAPAEPGLVASPADIRAAPLAPVGEALPPGPLREAWERARATASHAALLDEARAPATPAAIGPYTGKVGVPLAPKRFSPTALELLGQCASRYYLERLLGVEETGDEGVDLDPLETGSMLHEALATAAQEAIQAEGAWVLFADEAEREAHVGRVSRRVSEALDAASERYLASHPSLNAPLVAYVVARWKKVLERWIRREAAKPQGGLFRGEDAPELEALGEAELDRIAAVSPKVAEKLRSLRKRDLAATLALLDTARAAPAPTKTAAKQQMQAVEVGGAFNQAELIAAATTQAKAAREKALDALAAAARAEFAEAQEELRQALLATWGRDRLEVPPRVIAAEWSFGDEPPEGADPRSTTAPLVVELSGGKKVEVRGRIDRVDAAEDRPDAAVIDYKSGRDRSGKDLEAELGEGRHLQLPLYRLAVEQLLAKSLERRLHVVRGRLHFLRKAADPGVVFEHSFQPQLVDAARPEDGPVELGEVVKSHLAHCLDRLETGKVPLLPRSCPAEDGAACPCQVVCDYRPEARARFAGDDTQPLFAVPPRDRSSSPGEDEEPELTYELAEPVGDPPSSDGALERHRQGQERARDVRRDVVLAAGAGSGKTRALVDRYRAALEAGCGPENVLCITFTRKATAEMRSRIREKLLDEPGAAPPADLRRWLSALGTAPIQTIDAFAARLVAELTDDVLEVSDASAGFAEEFVSERLAKEAARPAPELVTLLEALPVPRVRAVLARLLNQPALRTVKLGKKAIREGWEAEAARLLGELPDRLAELAARAGKAAKATPDAAATLGDGLDGLQKALAAFGQHGPIAGMWALGMIRPGNRGPRKPPEEIKALKEEIKAARGEASKGWYKSALAILGDCESPADVRKHLDREAGIAAAALEVARAWSNEFDAARLERGFVSYDDVLARATRAVAECPPADLQARFPVRHILVDEFQDTSDAQLRLVRLLQERLEKGGPRPSLFVVGDPKQSIYRFRGAEVDLFQEFWVEAPKSSRAELSVCWRAEPELSRSLSRLFARVFDERLDPAAAVPWEPLAPRSNPGKEPRIELLVGDDYGKANIDPDVPSSAALEPSTDTGEEREGAGEEKQKASDDPGLERALVRRVKELLRSAEPAREESPIAILTHAWDRAIHYGQILREHGVPAFVQGGRGLLGVREVRELFLWLQALAREDDDLVFAALLRSATVGVSDPGLYALRNGFGLELRDYSQPDKFAPARRRNALSSLRQGFRFDAARATAALEQEAKRPLDVDVSAALRRDEDRLRRFGETWEDAARSFGLVPLSETLARILEATGHEATVRSRPHGLEGIANVRALEELVRGAEVGCSPVDAVRELERSSEAGDDPAAAGFSVKPGAAVTVTVFHQAKGREWDTVIVPDLQKVELGRGWQLPSCDLRRLVQFDGKAWQRSQLPESMLENPEDLFASREGVGAKVLDAATAGCERAESRRLLYVACTRARERLVLGASWPDEEGFAKLATQGTLGLRCSSGWLQDVVFALQLRPGKDGLPTPGDGVWKDGRDFRWVRPEGEGYGDEPTASAAAAQVEPELVRLAARSVEPVALTIVNPSSAETKGPIPPATVVRPVKPPPVRGPSPFGGANDEGSAFHRTVQLWSYKGECPDTLVKQAVREVAGEWQLDERVARVRQLLEAQATCQPALLAELRAAAARGDVFHEVKIGYLRMDSAWVEGSIDLLYRDDTGSWHVVDYKTDRVADEAALTKRLEEYHGQVRAYADALRGQLPGGVGVKSMRLWLVGAGVVAGWEE